jgi:hypothetical protein
MKTPKEIAGIIRQFAKREDKTDRAGLRTLAELVSRRKNADAYQLWQHMDTFVREGLPTEAAQYLYLNRFPGKKRLPFNIVVSVPHMTDPKGKPTVFRATRSIEFPGDASNGEMAMTLSDLESELRKVTVQLEIGEPEKVAN